MSHPGHSAFSWAHLPRPDSGTWLDTYWSVENQQWPLWAQATSMADSSPRTHPSPLWSKYALLSWGIRDPRWVLRQDCRRARIHGTCTLCNIIVHDVTTLCLQWYKTFILIVITSFFDALSSTRLRSFHNSFTDKTHKFLNTISLKKWEWFYIISSFQCCCRCRTFIQNSQCIQLHHLKL